MSIERVWISQKGKDQLIKLKRLTGIKHWNVLCRWAFCESLADDSFPSPIKTSLDNAIEMDWKVFGGTYHNIYLALLKERCHGDSLGTSEEVLAVQLRLHLHRGIGILAGDGQLKNISGLLRKLDK